MRSWREHLDALAIRFSCLGMTGDLASMSLAELWAVYRFLLRISGE